VLRPLLRARLLRWPFGRGELRFAIIIPLIILFKRATDSDEGYVLVQRRFEFPDGGECYVETYLATCPALRFTGWCDFSGVNAPSDCASSKFFQIISRPPTETSVDSSLADTIKGLSHSADLTWEPRRKQDGSHCVEIVSHTHRA
jgi:hypothetical protein